MKGTSTREEVEKQYEEAQTNATATQKDLDEKIQLVGTTGGGSSYWEYCIHQIEMIVTLMGTGATRLMQTTGGPNKHVVIEYADGRIAHVNYSPCFPETLMVAGDKSSTIVHQCSNFFPTLLDTILKFFNDRIVPLYTDVSNSAVM